MDIRTVAGIEKLDSKSPFNGLPLQGYSGRFDSHRNFIFIRSCTLHCLTYIHDWRYPPDDVIIYITELTQVEFSWPLSGRNITGKIETGVSLTVCFLTAACAGTHHSSVLRQKRNISQSIVTWSDFRSHSGSCKKQQKWLRRRLSEQRENPGVEVLCPGRRPEEALDGAPGERSDCLAHSTPSQQHSLHHQRDNILIWFSSFRTSVGTLHLFLSPVEPASLNLFLLRVILVVV